MKRFRVTVALLVSSLLLLGGCAPNYEAMARKTIEEAKQREQLAWREIESLLEQSGDVNRIAPATQFSPLIAAVYADPSQVKPLIEAGADVEYALTFKQVLHQLAASEYNYRNSLHFDPNRPYDFSHDMDAMEALLKAGADPNSHDSDGRTPIHYVLLNAKGQRLVYGSSDPADIAMQQRQVERAAMLRRYGADLTVVNPLTQLTPLKEATIGLDEVNHFGLFLYQAQKHPVDRALQFYRYGLAKEQSKREAEMADREARNRQREQKRQLIAQAFREDADLRSALNSLKGAAASCFTLGRVSHDVDEFGCGEIVNGNNFHSESCIAYQEQLQSALRKQRQQVCTPYRDHRKQLARLFKNSAGIADDVIGDALEGLPSVEPLQRVYEREIRRMRDIRDREARQQKIAEDRAFQQGMYSLAQYAERSFRTKSVADQIVEKSVADTQRTLYAIDNAQKMAKINADLEALNKRLEQMDKPVAKTSYRGSVVSTASSASVESSKSRTQKSTAANPVCVAQAESTGPMPNVPKRYCQYVFSDSTDNVSISWGDYSSQFNSESSTLALAQQTIHTPLLEKAAQVCKTRGFTRVHHPETYDYNKVAHRVTDCRENNRMGSTLHLCIGTASFICAR